MSSILHEFVQSVNGHQPEVNFRLASEIQPERIIWIWYGFLAQGKLSLLEGHPKLGKSTLTADITARVTTGAPFPGHTTPRTPRGVVLLSAEDGPADTIVPRLLAAGADLSRVSIPSGVQVGEKEAWIGIDKHLAQLERHIQAIDAQLLIVDPLMAYLGDVNAHKDQDVRAALGPLMAMLDRTGCAALLVRHLNKASGSDIVTRGGGSIGISGAARMGMFVARNPDDDSRRVLAQSLTNLTPEQPSLGFWIESQPGSDVARIAWEDTPVRYNAEDLLSAAQNEEERTERTDAAEWLMDYLREGPVPSAQVYRDAKKDGHAERTIRRAQASLNIKAVKEGFGKEGHWVWRLPDKDVPNMSNGPLCQSEATFSHVSSSSGHLRETNMATHNEHVHRWPQNGNMAKLDNLAVPWEETT